MTAFSIEKHQPRHLFFTQSIVFWQADFMRIETCPIFFHQLIWLEYCQYEKLKSEYEKLDSEYEKLPTWFDRNVVSMKSSEVNLTRMLWVWKAGEVAELSSLSVFSVQLLSNDAQSYTHYHSFFYNLASST